MQHSGPAWVTEELLAELNGIRAYAPEHLPCEIRLMEAVRRRCPDLRQLACFDTAFHRTLPRVATLIPLPRRYETEGIQRYGFHGLSYAYLIQELATLGDVAATHGRVLLAHLGNGASLAAVRDGKSIDTSMGFTPASGLPMGTRSGDLDPGVFGRLAAHGGMTAAQIDWMVNHESGLLGLSGISSDMRDLLALEGANGRAADAVELFCYQTRKWIGAFAAVLGGLDTLVFSGGIGENCPTLRWRICAELGFLGVELDPDLNAQAPGVISSGHSRVSVRVICTDEELTMARLLVERLQPDTSSGPPLVPDPSAPARFRNPPTSSPTHFP
jgi:acetate kinase